MKKVSPVTGQPDYPGQGWSITSGYMTDAYFEKFGSWHTGHDLARSQAGGETVYAVADGQVLWAEHAGEQGFGNLVVIKHDEVLYSRYAHLARIDVQRHQTVSAGTPIGILGSTGRSTAPHLHFDLARVSNALDWPGKQRDLVTRNYIDPHLWYRDAAIAIEAPILRWVQINAPAMLNVRAAAALSAGILSRLPDGSRVEVKGGRVERDGLTWLELVGGGWIAEKFTLPVADMRVGMRDPQPSTPAPIPAPLPPPRFTIEARGVHASAGGWAPTAEELDYVRHNGVKSVLIAAYEPNQAALAINGFRSAGVRDFIIRAATSAVVHVSPDDYAVDTLSRLQEYRAALGDGTRMIVAVHNEPNIDREGLGKAWKNAAEFNMWYLRVVELYRHALPGVLIGFPAMSPGGDVDIPGVVKRVDEWRFVNDCASGIAASDWVGVHAYFVNDGRDLDLKPNEWRAMAQGRPVIITEGGPADNIPNSGAKLKNVYRVCADSHLPVMAWLLSGAGAWHNADWLKNGVRV